MSSISAWPVPFIIDPQHLAVDAVTSFCVAILLTVLINAEAQAFASTFLGDRRINPKDRFHFIAFFHLDLLGTICYLVAGFGWPRIMDIDAGKFKHPRLYTFISRLAGPVANLLLAGIAGSLVSLMKTLEYNPRVFMMVVGVNVTTAVCNLILLPPLAGGYLVGELIPLKFDTIRKLFYLAGPYFLLALALLDRLHSPGIFSPYIRPLITHVFEFITR